jgi:putative phage-type endonuclease
MTASNAAAAIGIKPYDSFRGDPKIACIDQIVSGSFKGNAATRHGCEHEDAVRNRYCDVSGQIALDFGLIVHPTYDWLAASPDGITLTGQMIEIKCPMHREIVPGHVPHHYYPQVQTQMEVCDLESCAFVQWKPAKFTKDGKDIFDIVIVPRDRQWFARHKEMLYEFWCDLMSARAEYMPPPPPSCLIRDTLYEHLVATAASPMFIDSD